MLLIKCKGRTGRISAEGIDNTDRAEQSPYRKDRGQIFSQYGPEQVRLIRRGTLGICSVAVLGIFLCGVAVKKIPACGVAVISSLTVCDVCILKSMVYGETKLSAVFPFP